MIPSGNGETPDGESEYEDPEGHNAVAYIL